MTILNIFLEYSPKKTFKINAGRCIESLAFVRVYTSLELSLFGIRFYGLALVDMKIHVTQFLFLYYYILTLSCKKNSHRCTLRRTGVERRNRYNQQAK